jgi:anti-sigma regulatory factor (Ser/Thr protein kinase)
MPPDEQELSKLRELTVEPDRIVVRAEDQGPGIADIEQAMQPGFSTAPDWVRELGFGAGMGLLNIKMHTDAMTLDSQLGKGTTLEFVVYCNRSHDA